MLRPGGILLNFDANWYGYLYDEEKREAYEQDRKNVESQSLEDHYLCTDIDAMERIARKVPLSHITRPQWDTEVMEETGFEEISWDNRCLEAGMERGGAAELRFHAHVYGDRTQKYGEVRTEMTDTVRDNGKRESFSLGGLTAAPGERVQGELALAEGKFLLPAAILHGTRPGKTVLITAGVHSGEYVGIQAAVELAEKLKIEKVAGTVVIVKVVNRPAFEQRAGSMVLEDGENLNRVFPGDPAGSASRQLADAMVRELFGAADYYIDLHSGDDYEKLASYVYYAGKAAPEVVEASRKMAQQVDVPYMVCSDVASGGAYNYAASAGIPSILIERGGMGDWSTEEVRSMRRDVRNILCGLGVYLGQKDYRTYYPLT